MFHVAACTDKGPRKKSNQDSCLGEIVRTAHGEVALIMVCDGVGGLASGELASSSVVRWFMDWFEHQFAEEYDQIANNSEAVIRKVQYEWNIGLDALNNAVRQYGNENDQRLGTTCTALLCFNGNFVFAHVGDSRVYRFSNGSMRILTQDQTWVAQEVARGNISPEKARFHPKRNVILQAVGTQIGLEPVFGQGTYSEGDTFMVCCDGFRNELFDDELLETFGNMQELSPWEIKYKCQELVNLVLNRGEKDNVTVVCLSCQSDQEIDEENLAYYRSETSSLDVH